MRCVRHISLPTVWGAAAVAATHITLFARERDVSISAVCGRDGIRWLNSNNTQAHTHALGRDIKAAHTHMSVCVPACVSVCINKTMMIEMQRVECFARRNAPIYRQHTQR